jgi:hypothetical protein
MEIPIALPLDADGFLWRECPTCEREFKWFSGATAGRPDDFVEPENYSCPYCGVPSAPDTWWTPAQLEYAEAAAAGPMMEQITENLKSTLGRHANSGFIQVKVKPGSIPEPPLPLVEPNDMTMVAPPCHDFEPLKIADNWAEPLHCLMCGTKFRI